MSRRSVEPVDEKVKLEKTQLIAGLSKAIKEVSVSSECTCVCCLFKRCAFDVRARVSTVCTAGARVVCTLARDDVKVLPPCTPSLAFSSSSQSPMFV